ncbi:uncharacterized protein MYCFIDRAFT_85287 [Pseudocercospora fijiensis CIRAD86]|uniref:DUF3328 domain-containing protein n=1 Tax=Pseudocercospora fijiensis (strain CIRAD86) TaxID=383855 RepID=M3A1Z1_PSEFD|nr:uncharacterized protein MYCFIDRAFT_85287 [Pseudocercospora fijiensis CIRAD86]EME85184.1 hypothetical protein MYCFIDRAFT_85287 [Pseudocercospora fijiensis CIRAD86]
MKWSQAKTIDTDNLEQEKEESDQLLNGPKWSKAETMNIISKLEKEEQEKEKEDEESDQLLLNGPPKQNQTPKINKLTLTIYTLLLSIILTQTLLLLHLHTTRPPSKTIFGLPTARTIPRPSGLQNKYWPTSPSGNLTTSNLAWEKINPGHGAILVTPSFKTTHHLPETIRHPYVPEMYAYALEAYHMIHCIRVLRKDYLLLYENKVPAKPLEHAMHCFDALRQSVMCQASDEVLGITGRGHTGGVSQMRWCRDWDALREMATGRSACYWDEELPAEKEGERWRMCDGGVDGLPVGGILE